MKMTVRELERRAAPEPIPLARLPALCYFLRELALGQLRRRRNGARAFPRFEFAELAVVPPIYFNFSREPEFAILSPALDRALAYVPALCLLQTGEESFAVICHRRLANY